MLDRTSEKLRLVLSKDLFPFNNICVCGGSRSPVYRCPLRPHALYSLGAGVTGKVSCPAWMSGPPSQALCKLHGQAVCAVCFVRWLEMQRHTAGNNRYPILVEGASGPTWWHIDFRVQIRYVLEEREALLGLSVPAAASLGMQQQLGVDEQDRVSSSS